MVTFIECTYAKNEELSLSCSSVAVCLKLPIYVLALWCILQGERSDDEYVLVYFVVGWSRVEYDARR